MSLACPIGPEGNLLEPSERQCHRLWLENPILSLTDLEILKRTSVNGWKAKEIDITYDVSEEDLEVVLDKICAEAEVAARDHQFLVLTDRKIGPRRLHVSSALAVGAVHHHLINTRMRWV